MGNRKDDVNEVAAVLVGRRWGRIWCGRLRECWVGEPASVAFDWAWVLAREERHGDVIGFFHTHPDGPATPSERDVRTMRAWVSCFGKPLLCVIEACHFGSAQCEPEPGRRNGTTLTAYVFETDEDAGQSLAEVQRFLRNVLVGVDR
jgi:proteasome lid subunit RPN8/RPN11